MKQSTCRRRAVLITLAAASVAACRKPPVAEAANMSQAAPSAAAPLPVHEAINGAEEYATCSSCHLATGKGIAGKFPPLAGSALLLGDPEKPIAIVLDGLEGAVGVKGKGYLSQMGAWGQLSDAQIAGILTYARSSWGNHASAVTPEQVAAVRAATADRVAPWSIAELESARLR